ncbi:MAG TPA: thiol:disulfide interchange protein DsbA/DsbL [Usitatibacter sp.]|nr:thiol:disulfide interchange protein DsbA/DsbL [Usitatibacter sp.]
MTASRFFSRIAATLAFAALGAWAQAGLPWVKQDSPQPTEGNGKIEVIEFFWYGCPHCYRLEPSLEAWLKNKPADVVFKRVHALPGTTWMAHAKIFYTLETMGLEGKLHDKVFEAIHKDNKNLASQKVLDEFLANNGVDPTKYHEVEKSFSVDSKLKRANQMTVAYKVDGVPRIIVDGKLATGPAEAGGEDRMMQAVDQMIAAERKAGAGSQAAAAATKKK